MRLQCKMNGVTKIFEIDGVSQQYMDQMVVHRGANQDLLICDIDAKEAVKSLLTLGYFDASTGNVERIGWST